MKDKYFDHSATTYVRPEVVESMQKYYSENYVDILEWERYVSFKNQNWYVSNINYII